MNTRSPISPARDWIGIVASIGCALHCAAMPFAIAYLPMFGLSFLADEGFHRWMTLVCFVIALTAFVPGFRQHRRWAPGGIAVVGLSLISVAAFGMAGDCCVACELSGATAPSVTACADSCCEVCVVEAQQVTSNALSSRVVDASMFPQVSWITPSFLKNFAPWITPLGGMLLVIAHLFNRRLGCLCGCCESELLAKETE